MTLPPVTDLVAVHERDPRARIELRETLARFGDVQEPAPGWLAATTRLPGGPPPDDQAAAAGYVVIEGEDELAALPDHWTTTISRWLDDAPQRFVGAPGDVTLVRFGAHGTADVAVSVGGPAHVYWWASASRTVLTTRMAPLPAAAGDQLELDLLVNAFWACRTASLPDGRSFVSGSRSLSRAAVTRIGPGKKLARPVAYWRPSDPTEYTGMSAPERVDALREILLAALRRDLDPGGRNIVSLSGGVDSTALTALATTRADRPIAASVSLLPASGALRDHELGFIAPIQQLARIGQRHFVDIDGSAVTRLAAGAPAIPFQVIHPVLLGMPALAAEGELLVYMGGEFADQVCGHETTIGDWARSTPLHKLLTRPHSLPFGPRDLLRWPKHRLGALIGRPVAPLPYGLPDWIAPPLREEYDEWRRRFLTACTANAPARPMLEVCRADDGWLAMQWEVLLGLGLRRSLPFHNRRALELGFACHPSEQIGPGVKKLLRAALDGDVPHRNLWRPDKGGWAAGTNLLPPLDISGGPLAATWPVFAEDAGIEGGPDTNPEAVLAAWQTSLVAASLTGEGVPELHEIRPER